MLLCFNFQLKNFTINIKGNINCSIFYTKYLIKDINFNIDSIMEYPRYFLSYYYIIRINFIIIDYLSPSKLIQNYSLSYNPTNSINNFNCF